MLPACPPRSNRQSQPETARTSEEGEEKHEGRNGEKMRTCARLPAVLPSKSYIDRTPPPNGQSSTAPGQQAPQPAPAEAPSLPTYSRPFLSLSILLLETLQNTCSAVRVIWSVTIPSTTIWPMCFEGKGMIRLTAVRLLRCSSQVFKSENHFASLIWACSLH